MEIWTVFRDSRRLSAQPHQVHCRTHPTKSFIVAWISTIEGPHDILAMYGASYRPSRLMTLYGRNKLFQLRCAISSHRSFHKPSSLRLYLNAYDMYMTGRLILSYISSLHPVVPYLRRLYVPTSKHTVLPLRSTRRGLREIFCGDCILLVLETWHHGAMLQARRETRIVRRLPIRRIDIRSSAAVEEMGRPGMTLSAKQAGHSRGLPSERILPLLSKFQTLPRC